MTLIRTYNQLFALDSSLHREFMIPHVSPLPLLYGTASPSSSPPRKRRSPLLATLSRTLSPSKSRQMQSLLLAQVEPLQDQNALSPDPQHAPLAQLSGYLSNIARIPDVRGSKEWQKFFSLKHPEDSESNHVGRRVKKMRSDPAIAHRTIGLVEMATVEDQDDEMQKSKSSASEADPDLAELAAMTRQLAGEDSEDITAELPTPSTVGAATKDVFHTAPASALLPKDTFQEMDTSSSEAIILAPRPATTDPIPSKSQITFPSSGRKSRVKRAAPLITVQDFDVLSVLGKGCAGKVGLRPANQGIAYVQCQGHARAAKGDHVFVCYEGDT